MPPSWLVPCMQVLRNELYSAADDIRRSIGDNLANYMEENDRKMLVRSGRRTGGWWRWP